MGRQGGSERWYNTMKPMGQRGVKSVKNKTTTTKSNTKISHLNMSKKPHDIVFPTSLTKETVYLSNKIYQYLYFWENGILQELAQNQINYLKKKY